MTFFYDLNKKLDAIREKPETTNKQLNERDEGKPGKMFAKIAKDAGERYGSEAAGRRVAGSIRNKLRDQGKLEEEDIEEGPEIFKLKADAAKKAGEKTFQGPDGKTYPVKEAAKPDFPDIDKDGNRKESIKKAAADKKAKHEQELDEGWDDMMKDVERRSGQMKKGEKVQGHKGEIEKTATGIRHTRRYDSKTGETDTGDDGAPQGEKRGRGRPKGTGKSMGAKGPSGKSKLMTREEIDEAIAALEEAGYSISKLDEKAVSVAQRRAAGIAHAAQKGEIPKRELRGASAEMAKMPKGELAKFAKTKEKGLPKKKEESVEETTVAGSVAPAAQAPKSKSKGGVQFGKGIYDSMNRELETMIAESMNVSVNMSMDQHGEPRKNITVSAEGEAAEQLAQLLNLAGIAGKAHNDDHGSCGCDTSPCSCEQMVDENAPDWPTNTETGGEDDPHLQMYAGGLNKPKSTGQTTAPVVSRDPSRGAEGPAEMHKKLGEANDLGMNLYREYKNYKGKQ